MRFTTALTPGTPRASVTAYIVRVIDDPRVVVAPVGAGSDPSPVSDINAREFDALTRTISETTPDAVIAPYLLIGGTDSRHFSALSRNVFRFSAQRVGADDIKRAHGTDERAAVKNLPEVVRFYVRLIENMAVNTR